MVGSSLSPCPCRQPSPHSLAEGKSKWVPWVMLGRGLPRSDTRVAIPGHQGMASLPFPASLQEGAGAYIHFLPAFWLFHLIALDLLAARARAAVAGELSGPLSV